MRAVIVQIKKNDAAALDDAGTMHKIKNKNYTLGQVVVMETTTNTVRKTGVARYATAAVIAIVVGFGAWGFFSPYSYVSLDVNPSIEYSVNRLGLVLSAQAVNGDGEEILQDLHLNYTNIEDAIAATVDEIAAAGYFDGDDPGQIMIATACTNEANADQLCEQLQTQVMEMDQVRTRAIEVQGEAVGYERVQEAKALGMTPGKLNLIEKLIASSSDPDSVNVEDWKDVSVKDIMKTINTNKGNGNTNDNTTMNGSGSGSSDSDDTTTNSTDTTDTTVTTNGNGNGGSNSDNGNTTNGKGK